MNTLGMNLIRFAFNKHTYHHDMRSLNRLGIYWEHQFKYPFGATNYIPTKLRCWTQKAQTLDVSPVWINSNQLISKLGIFNKFQEWPLLVDDSYNLQYKNDETLINAIISTRSNQLYDDELPINDIIELYNTIEKNKPGLIGDIYKIEDNEIIFKPKDEFFEWWVATHIKTTSPEIINSMTKYHVKTDTPVQHGWW